MTAIQVLNLQFPTSLFAPCTHTLSFQTLAIFVSSHQMRQPQGCHLQVAGGQHTRQELIPSQIAGVVVVQSCGPSGQLSRIALLADAEAGNVRVHHTFSSPIYRLSGELRGNISHRAPRVIRPAQHTRAGMRLSSREHPCFFGSAYYSQVLSCGTVRHLSASMLETD